MSTSNFIAQLRNQIAQGRLESVLPALHTFLQDTPLLNDALHQSGRFAQIKRQVDLGTVNHKESTLTVNQIQLGVLNLLSEIETLDLERQDIRNETQQAAATIQITQHAEKIYNIQHIDKADFS